MSSLRILHIIETDGPGGAETVLVDLVRGLRGNGTVAAVVPTNDGWLGRTLQPSERLVVAPSKRGSTRIIDFPYLGSLRATVAGWTPTLVHAHSFDSALYAALALLGTSIPLVVTFHGHSDVERRTMRDRLKWIVLRRAQAIICVSHALAARAREVPGLPADRVRSIHNGSDLTRIPNQRNDALRTRLGLPPGTLLVGALGNVRGPKGYDLLLPAIATLRSEGVDLHLAIAGDDSGALGDQLRAQRATLGLDAHVSLLGYLNDPGAFLAGLDIFVLSSTAEGFSIATVQAMAAGLPVVATRSGGPEEIVLPGLTGLLVPASSSQALADGIAQLGRDRALGARLGMAARRRATECFSLGAMFGAYESLYREVTGR